MSYSPHTNIHHTCRHKVDKQVLTAQNIINCDMVCRSIDNEGAYDFITVKGERVDSVVQEDVLLMKLDVEGFEPTAFQSSKGILDTYKCAAEISRQFA